MPGMEWGMIIRVTMENTVAPQIIGRFDQAVVQALQHRYQWHHHEQSMEV
jgi:hypothetical protein